MLENENHKSRLDGIITFVIKRNLINESKGMCPFLENEPISKIIIHSDNPVAWNVSSLEEKRKENESASIPVLHQFWMRCEQPIGALHVVKA